MLWVLIAFLTGCSCQIHILKGTLMGPHHLAHQIAKPVIGDVPAVNIENTYDESNERPPRDLRQYEYEPQHDVNDRTAKDTPKLTSNVGEKFKPILNNGTNLQGKLTDRIKKVPKLQFGWVPPKNTDKADSQIKENVTHFSKGAADLDDVTAPSKKTVSNNEPKIGLNKLPKKIKKKIVKNALKDKPKYVLFYDKQYVTPDGRVIKIASNIPGRARNAEKPRRRNGASLKRPLLMTDTDSESIDEDEPKVGINGLIGDKLDKKIKKGAKKLLKNVKKGIIKMPVYTNVITFRDSALNRGMWRIADPEKPQRRYVAVPQDPIIEYLNNPTGNLEQPSDNDLERAETDTNTPEQSETGNYTDDEANINNLNYMRSQLLQYLMRYIRTTFANEASERNNGVTPLDPRLTNYYDNSQRNDNDGDNNNTSVSADENDDDNNKNDDNEHDENEDDENENVENEHGADEHDDHANDANENKENEQQTTQQQTQSDRKASPHNDYEKSSCATDSSNMGNNVVIVDLKKKSNLNAGESLTSTGSCKGTEKKKYVNAHREVNSTIISVGNVNDAKPNHSADCLHEAKHKTDKESENFNENHASRKVSLHFDLDLSSK